MDKEVENIVNGIKDVDNSMNNIIVPVLKDTIKDYKKTIDKLFIIVIIQIVALFAVITYSSYLYSKSSEKYTEFVDKFDFETEGSNYYQDVDSTDGGDATVNSGIVVSEGN